MYVYLLVWCGVDVHVYVQVPMIVVAGVVCMHFKSGRFFCFMQSARENQGHEHGTRMHGPYA